MSQNAGTRNDRLRSSMPTQAIATATKTICSIHHKRVCALRAKRVTGTISAYIHPPIVSRIMVAAITLRKLSRGKGEDAGESGMGVGIAG